MILRMAGPRLVKPSLFEVFAISTVILTALNAPWAPASAAEERPSLDVARDKDKTVYTVDSPGNKDEPDTARSWDMLQKLIIDSGRGDDGKGPDSDRRGRGEHP
jgi:hypothetical protein